MYLRTQDRQNHPKGTISGIGPPKGSKKRKRSSSSLRTKQGQHTTAYVVFEHEIWSAVLDRTPRQAAAELADLADRWLALPRLGSTHADVTRIRDALEERKERLLELHRAPGDTTAEEIAAELDPLTEELLALRNQVPGTALNTKNTGGHGEASMAGALQAMEKLLRADGDDALDGEPPERVAELMWGLLDYNPPPTADTNEVGRFVETHVRSLMSAYPQLWAWLSDATRSQGHLLPWLRSAKQQGGYTGALWRTSDQDLQTVETDLYAHMGW